MEALVAWVEPTDLRVLLIGIDGACFRVLKPLLQQGRLPVMERLIGGGAHGVLGSDPPMLSPAIWTSIVTGRDRYAHGITGFCRNGDGRQVLVSSNDRRVTALWNWLGAFGRTTGFAGWWATWPAEPVDGWIVSDRITRTRMTEWFEGSRTDGLTEPPELVDELAPLVIDPARPAAGAIRELVELTEEEWLEYSEADEPVFAHGPSVLKFAYSAQRSYEQIALHMLQREQPDLTGVFLVANDPICHTFWHYHEPERFPGVDPEKAARLGQLPLRFSEHNDRFIGELLASVGPETVVLIVSDHGFQASGILPEQVPAESFDALHEAALVSGRVAVGQTGQHHADGILVAHGPPIRAGAQVRAHVFDVTPTILALLGLPVAEDMEGRVLTEILDPAFLAAHPVRTIPSYEHYFERIHPPESGAVDGEEFMKQLRAIGYLR